MKFTKCIGMIVCAIISINSFLYAQNETVAAQDKARLDAVIMFARNVLADGKDRYSGESTPLLVNGVNTITKEPVIWTFPNGSRAVMADFVCQQNLLRTLVSLSNITGDTTYKHAAKELVQYYFDHLRDKSGLLWWGGHKFIDVATLKAVGPDEKGGVHELKNAYPYYDFLYEVNPEATVKFIKAFWNAHVFNWKTLEISRHGHYGLPMGNLWNNTFVQQKPFFETNGLSFLDAGDDLIYSGLKLYEFTGDTGALAWAKRLAYQYVLARNPQTKLGAYQYTQPKKTAEPHSDSETFSTFGDRAHRQFGPEYKSALEGTMLLQRHAQVLYVNNALMELQMAQELSVAGNDLRDWTREGMTAYAHYAYNSENNLLRPMLTDGTDLSNAALQRDGYYGSKGTVLPQVPAGTAFLLSYVRGSLFLKDSVLWNMARNIAKGNGLGDIGTEPGKNVFLNNSTSSSDALAIFALVELYARTHRQEYLNLARVVGNNLVVAKFHKGYFTKTTHQQYASFDVIEPYALLSLDAAIKGTPEKVPVFFNGAGFAQGEYKFPDGTVRTINDDMLYTIKR